MVQSHFSNALIRAAKPRSVAFAEIHSSLLALAWRIACLPFAEDVRRVGAKKDNRHYAVMIAIA